MRHVRRVHAHRARRAPDVLIVEPGDSGSIKIDQVRDVVDRAAYRPFEGRRRVVIIDEADALVAAAQNALLKTLEEPPSSSVFILVTSRPDVLLPTVRSRCPRLRFRPLSADDIAAALMARGHSETEARAVAATADGSLGRALEASAGDLVEARDVAAARARAGGGDATIRRGGSRARRICSPKTGAGGASDREQLATHLRAMASLLRDVELAVDRRGRPRAREPRRAARARAADAGVSRRARRARVCGGRSGAGGARAERRRQDRGRLAGAAAMSAVAVEPRPARRP